MTRRVAHATETGPAIGSFAITAGSSALPLPIRALTLTTGGVVVYISSADGRTYDTEELTAGTYTFFASHILSVGTPWITGVETTTTASGFTGWT